MNRLVMPSSRGLLVTWGNIGGTDDFDGLIAS